MEEVTENIFYITEFWNRKGEIVAYDCEALIGGHVTGIFQYSTGQECTQKFIALEQEYGETFDKIKKTVEFVD